jgi:cytochrome c biogenesis factor
MSRPIDVTLSAIYYAAFSAVLIAVLFWQLLAHGTQERWFNAVFPILFMLLLSLIPAVISLGLWTLDNAARIGSVMFAFLHIIVTSVYLTHVSGSRTFLPVLRIGLDLLIIVAMLRPGVRRAFRWEPAELRLGIHNR